jgi:asparagine synthase (glutamine-hydrolysing)
MCGIAGVFRSRGVVSDLDGEALGRMLFSLRHRGPDGEGRHADRSVVLGHRRLAVIDLSPEARGPMGNETGDVWLTFNGEIYNFRELRSELRGKGHVFRSQTDAEVVVHGYEEWGIEALLQRLSGMFAFALWDARERKLYLVRDRFGIKPLYYARTSSSIVFASELRALAASGLIEAEPSDRMLPAFLAQGSIPAPDTALDGVLSVPAAHYLELSREGERQKEYWRLPRSDRSEGEEKVGASLRDAVEKHLVSDVPLGVFLSGGIDSACLVSLASRFLDRPLATLSIVFDDPVLDESRYARSVAAAYRTDHREVRIGAADFNAALPGFFEAMDQPTVDGVNSFLVSRAAKETGLTVVLTGLGGDEVFLGYPHFRRIQSLSRWPSWLLPAFASFRRFQPRAEYLREPTASNVYSAFRGLFAPREIEALLPGAVAPPLRTEREELLDGAVDLEFRCYLGNQLLRDTDSMSMAHSIEARVPFLDHRLVESVVRLSHAAKLSGEGNKPLLLRSLEEPLPREVWDRPKRGFTLPFRRFLMERREELLARTLAFACFEADAVRRLWIRFAEGRVHWSRPWAIFAYGSWRESFRKREGARESLELTSIRA